MFHNFAGEFEKYKDTRFINLNNGTLGLCPSSVIDLQKAELESFELNTSLGLGNSWQRLWGIQERLAKFLNTNASDLFLRPNVTLALNEIVMGLSLPAGSEILTTTFEYGAVVNILKFKAQKGSLSLRFIQPDFLYQDISANAAVDLLMQNVSDKTRVLAISHIFTGNGIEIPLKELAAACRKKSILLVVDGAHAPGIRDLDFDSDFKEVDYYAGNLHKWFMGPKGTAFGWVNPIHQSKTGPCYGSWTTDANTPPVMQAFSQTPFSERMLWSHSQSFSSYYGLEACFDFWDHHGKNVIFKEIELRMKYLEEGLRAKGLTPLKSADSEVPARLLCYKLDDFKSIEFDGLYIKNAKSLVQVGLPKVPGVPVLRLTPHIHNTQTELDTAIQVLSALV
ncbi:aminotransferase class V-fold PLP-dependent enzyme [Bdellovibrio sp. HCB274]|uniref:aminotransferase class V-fold PLP-dependent enzyme n=1 Tax=Bdellovibrio sp. HCB274 TaxID=3394361 RepID=UPI0039B5F5BD